MRYFIAGCILFLYSCEEVKEKPGSNSAKDSLVHEQHHVPASENFPSSKKDKVKALAIQTFKDLPKEIDGCSGLYKLTNCKEDCDYVFATNLQGKAFIKVEGKIISLKRINTSVTDKKTKERYEGEGFTITIEVYYAKQIGDEVQEYYGELKVVKDDLKISESITGEVGC